MLRRYLLATFAILAMFFSSASYALPFHIFTKAGTQLPTQVELGSSVTAYYTVINNTADQRNGNYVKHLPPNVTQVTSGGTYGDTCTELFNLAPVGQAGDSCTLQLKISGPINDRDTPDQHLFVCFPKGKTCAGTVDPLNVTQTFPTSIAITPLTASIDAQNTQQYTAIGSFADGLVIDITTLVNWTSSNTTVATISNTGFATGGLGAGGTTTINANIHGVISNNASLSVAPELTIVATPSTLKEVSAGYLQTNVGSGGFTPYTYSVIAGALPAGTTLNTATGTVSGTPTALAAGAFSYTVEVRDLDGKVASVRSHGTIAAAVTIAATASTFTEVNVAYSQTNVASNGITPYVYTLSAGALPTGTSLNAATGTVSGIPTVAETSFTYTIKVTDSQGVVATVTTTGTIKGALAIVATPSTSTQIGVAYSQTNVASGGFTPYVYTITAGALPAGTTLSPTTGTVSGTPTIAGGFTYTITVTDADNVAISAQTSGTIALVGLVANPSADTEVGAPYSQTNVVSGGFAPLVYNVSSGSLPAGTTLNTTNGTVSGVPTTGAVGAFNYTIQVTDAQGNTATASTSGTIVVLSITATPSTNTEVGIPYSQTNVASSGTLPYVYSVSSGTLPNGTSLNPATGTVSGTPTTGAGGVTFHYTIQVLDHDGQTASAATVTTIAATVTLTAVASTLTEVGAAYSQTNTVAGGTAPYTYIVSAGALPDGTTLNPANGTVSGVPLADSAGAFSYTIQVTDSLGVSATATSAGTIATAVSIVATPSTYTQVNVTYTQTNVASGGTTPYTYSVISGSIPNGTAFSTTTGTVTGTPTSAGAFSYTVQVTDADGIIASVATSGTITTALAIAATPSTDTEVGATYSQANEASGGTLPYVYTLSAGALPAGTTLSPTTGTVSGTPTTAAAGAFNYTIQVTDADGAIATVATSGTMASALVITPTPSVNTEVGATYSQTNIASGGTTPYVFSLAAGAIPTGTFLSTTSGTVSGTPTQGGAFNYTIAVTDADGITVSAVTSGTITGGVALTPTNSFDTVVGRTYSQTNVGSGGSPPYVFTLYAGSLPNGLSLSSTSGTVSGTPTTAGPINYTIELTDTTGATATATTTGTMAAVIALTATPSTYTGVGAVYSQVNTVSGGKAPFTYTISNGATPLGTTLNPATGTVSGTPTTAGVFNYTVTVTDSDGTAYTATAQSTGTIATAVTLTATASPATEVGRPYSQTNVAAGGIAPYTYSVSAGTLPLGTSLNTSTGTVSGTTSTAGAFSYTIKVADSDGASTTAATSGTIASTVALTATASTNTEVGVGYQQANTASGGTPPYTYALFSGSLPNGTAIVQPATPPGTGPGDVSGTPTASGSFSYTIQVTDAAGATATAPTNGFMIGGVTLTATPSTNQEINTTYTQTNAAGGGTPPYTYTLTTGTGSLPVGTTFNSTTATVSGTTTVAGPYSYTIQVVDSIGGTTTATVSGTIATTVTIASTPSTVTETGAPYSQANVASNGNTPYTYSLSAGNLPTGTTLSQTMGTVSGTPAASSAGAFTYTIKVTDGAGVTATTQTNGTMTAGPTIVAGAPTGARVNQAYSQTNVASGGVSPYTYSLFSGTLPAGTAVSPTTGTVSGTPTTAATYTYAIAGTDSLGGVATASTTVTIIAALAADTSSKNDADTTDTTPSSGGKKSAVEYIFNGATGAIVNHLRFCLATDDSCNSCDKSEDMDTSIEMGTPYPVSVKMLDDYLMKHTSGKLSSTNYIGVYASSTGANCSTPEGDSAYCGTGNVGKKTARHICIAANSINGFNISSVSTNGGTVYLTRPAQYVYASDLTANRILQCVPNADGTFSNCSSIASINSPYATAFTTVSGIQYGYVTAGDGNVYQCALSHDGANTFTCNILPHEGVTPSSPQAIAFLTLNKNQYVYLGNANGSVYVCPVSNDGTFGLCAATAMTNGSNAIAFQALNKLQYIYGINSNGSIEKCTVGFTDGSLSNCDVQSGPNGTATGLGFRFMNDAPLAYVTSNSSAGNLVYYSSLDATGNFTKWASTRNPAKASRLIGISFATVNKATYANVSAVDGTIYQCTVDHNSGNLTTCNLTSKTGASLTSSITPGYALAGEK